MNIKGVQSNPSSNELGHFAPSALRYWTALAIECYQRRFDCIHCPNYYLMRSQPCQMKAAVLELYRKFGEPTAENVRRSYDIGGKQDLFNGKRKKHNQLSKTRQDNR